MKLRKIFSILGTIAICVAMLTSCEGETKDYTVLTDSTIGEEDGYSYELWKDYGDTTMTLTGDGKFTCEWGNINNCLFRTGKKFDCTQTYREIGNIELKYDVDYNPDGNSYLCLYGWTREPLIEYYVVESWGNWRPPGGAPLGTIEVDGADYDVYRTLRVNQPSIDGNTTFEQYWSVRREKSEKGTINAAAHFAAWESLGMKMGKMYEAALTVEGYQSSGSAEVKKYELSIGGEIPESELPKTPEPPKPDENGYYFYSDFESDDGGWVSRGSASVSRSDAKAYAGNHSLVVTGRTDAWHGTSRDLSTVTFVPGNTYSFSVMVMQDKKDSEDFKLTLQYNTSSGTNYDGVAEVTAAKGEWAQLVNTEYTVPEGAWGLLLYVETASGKDGFYIDEATGAIEGVAPAVETEQVPQETESQEEQ